MGPHEMRTGPISYVADVSENAKRETPIAPHGFALRVERGKK